MVSALPDPVPDAIPLSQLRAGCHATLACRLMEAQDGEMLAAMGLTDRCRLRVCRAGEPCIVQVAGFRLGLAAALARRILVVPIDVRPGA
jgi:Fe2+ transport system protein FeoA